MLSASASSKILTKILWVTANLAPLYEFYISNLTKIKYCPLTVFLRISSPLPEIDQPNQREGHSEIQDFCKI